MRLFPDIEITNGVEILWYCRDLCRIVNFEQMKWMDDLDEQYVREFEFKIGLRGLSHTVPTSIILYYSELPGASSLHPDGQNR